MKRSKRPTLVGQIKRAKIQAKNKQRDMIFLSLLKQENLPIPESEFKFCPNRRFSFDFAYIEQRIALEIEGGIYTHKMGHSSITGILRDIEKYNLAAICGWRVIRILSNELHKKQTFELIKKALDYNFK